MVLAGWGYRPAGLTILHTIWATIYRHCLVPTRHLWRPVPTAIALIRIDSSAGAAALDLGGQRPLKNVLYRDRAADQRRIHCRIDAGGLSRHVGEFVIPNCSVAVRSSACCAAGVLNNRDRPAALAV